MQASSRPASGQVSATSVSANSCGTSISTLLWRSGNAPKKVGQAPHKAKSKCNGVRPASSMCNSSTENTHKLYTQQVNKRTKLLAGFASEICCFESNLSVLVHLLRGLDNARFSHCLAELSSVEASDLRSVAPANMALLQSLSTGVPVPPWFSSAAAAAAAASACFSFSSSCSFLFNPTSRANRAPFWELQHTVPLQLRCISWRCCRRSANRTMLSSFGPSSDAGGEG